MTSSSGKLWPTPPFSLLSRDGKKSSLLSLLFLALFLSYSTAQTSGISFRYDRDTIFPGDTARLQLEIKLTESNIEEILLDSNTIFDLAGKKALDIVSAGNWNAEAAMRGRLTTSDNSLVWETASPASLTNTITAVFWRPGNYYAPGFRLVQSTAGFRDTLYFPPFQFPARLTVLTPQISPELLEKNDSLQLAAIKPIIREPFKLRDLLPYFWIYLLVGLLLFGLYFLFFRPQKEETPPAFIEKKIPPHLLALARLKRLQQGKLPEQSIPKVYYSELTYILREYLEKQFSLPALEATSSEILQSLKGDGRFTGKTNGLQPTFELADAVKFAKAHPPDERRTEAFSAVETFVLTTAPKEAPDGEGEKREPYTAHEEFRDESLKPAPPVFRLFAALLDFFLAGIIILILGKALSQIGALPKNTLVVQLFLLVAGLILVIFLFDTLAVSRLGGTPGKMVFGIGIRDEEGNRLSFLSACKRFLIKLLLGIGMGGLAVLPIFFNTERKALYDRLAKTLVVQIRKREKPLLDSLDQAEMK